MLLYTPTASCTVQSLGTGCYMDSMVGTVLTIESEVEVARNTRDTGVGSKREDQLSPSSGKRQKTSASH